MIKIAFGTDSLDVPAAIERASRLGYDGIELRGSPDPAKNLRQIFTTTAIEISALNLGPHILQLSKQIAFAADVGCHRIRIKSDSLLSRSGIITSAATTQLLSAADQAAAAGVSILIENQSVPGAAIRLWHLLDRLNHPAIACCWNTTAAALANDLPAIAVPTLNSRIHYLQAKLDEDTTQIRKTMNRLRGIGFGGYLLVATAGASTQNISEFEQSLANARSILQQWQILPTVAA